MFQRSFQPLFFGSFVMAFVVAFVVASVAACCLGVSPVAAQSAADASRDASARALFQDGVQLAEQSQWEGAEDRFRRALALHSSPVIAYNLANALSERGKLIEASELLLKLQHDEKLDPGLMQTVSTLQSELAPRIGRLTVNVHGAVSGDTVKLDDVAMLDAQLGVALPADPGTHRLSLERAGKSLDTQSVEVAVGGSAEVTLQPLVAPTPSQVAAASPVASAAPSDATASGAHADSRPVTKTWWFWTGVGVVGVAAVVLVAVLAGGSSSGSSGGTQAAYQGNFNPSSLQVEVR